MPHDRPMPARIPELNQVRALAFDVGGTVFDWHATIRNEVQRLAAERGASVDGAALANAWRRRMFELLAEVRTGALPWQNADTLHRRALDDVLPDFPTFPLRAEERDELNGVWHRLHAWPDAATAIARLRERYTVVVLTVLSWSIVVDSSKVSGVGWDGILSCEFLGHYKPDRDAYLAGARLLGLAPHQVMMVAAHPWDLRAALAAGFQAAYIPRPGERGAGNDPDLAPLADVAVNARDFGDLADQLLR